MGKEESVSVKLSRKFEIPQEALSQAPRITVSGMSSVLVEGHRGLLEYEPERVAAAAGAGGKVIIKGENLRLVSMSRSDLTVSGKLWAVELE